MVLELLHAGIELEATTKVRCPFVFTLVLQRTEMNEAALAQLMGLFQFIDLLI